MLKLKEKNSKILVVGDLIIDQYLWGSCDRISPEAPVQVVNISENSKVLGGAGNVVNNLKQLGAEVDILSVTGACEASNELKYLLKEIQVDSSLLIQQDNRIVSKKTRIIASQQQVVRYDFESSEDINQSSQKKILNTFKNIIRNYDLVLLSDYGKGVLSTGVTRQLISIANSMSIKVLVDPKGADFNKYKGAFLITPNLKEASEATNIKIIDNKSLLKAIVKLKSQLDLEISLITMSEKGIAFYDHKLHIKPTVAKEVYDVTGAGDTVLSSLGYAIACNMNINDAIDFSNLAAGVVVSKIGSATATLPEIVEYEMRINKKSSTNCIKNIYEISELCYSLKKANNKIIFTNGCFDILHSGHIKYLEAAKNLGDILIVGLNSDRSVKALKGKNRPINSENERASVLAGLESIDYVVIFDEDTPYELIKIVRPHTLVKGNDYQDKIVVGENLVNKVVLAEFIKGKSSSQIIDKIKKI